MNNYLDILVAFLPDWDPAQWHSQAQYYSSMGHSHSAKIDMSCWMTHFAHYTSVYEPIFTSDCSIYSQNISPSVILSQATYRTRWNHSDPFCPTFSCFPFSSMFPMQWRSSTPCQPVSLTSMLAESIRENVVWHSHPGALGDPEPWCRGLALYWIHCQLPSHGRSPLDYLSHHFS